MIPYCRICTSKLKLKQENVEVYGPSLIIIRPDPSKHSHALNAELQRLLTAIPNVVVAGLPQVSRAVIAVDDARGPPTYKLCVEGYGLRDVMATYGVVGAKTKSNNILEVYTTLGIEAARTTIMNEITDVMEGHGMSVDHRHIMLLASQMTSRGEVLGITRHGLAKMRESVFNLASVRASSLLDWCTDINVGLFLFCSLRKRPTICSMQHTTVKRTRLMGYRNELFSECRPPLERDCSS